MAFFSKAQYSTQIICGPSISPVVNFVYVGTINLPPENSANCQKLQVDILGNNWFGSSIGQTTFYIANREGLTVNQVVVGGSGINGSSLVAYPNPDGYGTDFYLNINSSIAYYSFAVKAYLMAGLNATPIVVSITTQSSTPAGSPVVLHVNPFMITDDLGNIGISTTNPNPAYKLSVNGNIRAKEVKVEVGWSDYVFDENYSLRSLKEIEEYIVMNKHLPDVPSANDVERNGVEVGKTEALLLRKIEELTLYLIQKDKQIEQQKSINQSYENRLKIIEQKLNTIKH